MHLDQRHAAARAAPTPPRPARRGPGDRARPDAVPFDTAGEMSALLHTERGDIALELYPRDAPQTVANWTTLARTGYFTGLIFHRVVPNFVIQAGDPDSTGSGGPGYAIPDEFNRHRYGPGALGMALSGPDTGGSQWFITHSPQPHLDGRYTIFGQVIGGQEVVDAIEEGDAILGIDVTGAPPAPARGGRRRR